MSIHTLSKRDLRELENCKLRGFLIRHGRKNPPFDDCYYAWCRRAGKPYVKLKLRRKYGDIDVDTPSDPGRLDLEGKKQFNDFLDRWGLYPKNQDMITGGVGDVPLGDIEKMARELFDITQGFLDRHTKAKQIAESLTALAANGIGGQINS